MCVDIAPTMLNYPFTNSLMDIPEEYLQYLSPLGWEHINVTDDYVWNLKQATSFEKLRPLLVKENKYR